MAKAILCAQSPINKAVFAVTQVYPDGTNMQNVSNPPSGSLLIPVQGDFWSVGDTVTDEHLCSGLAVILASISTVNWTQVKQAIN